MPYGVVGRWDNALRIQNLMTKRGVGSRDFTVIFVNILMAVSSEKNLLWKSSKQLSRLKKSFKFSRYLESQKTYKFKNQEWRKQKQATDTSFSATAILDHQIWKASSHLAYEKIFSPVNVLVKMRTRNVVCTESPAMTWEGTKILFMGTSQPKRKLPLLSNPPL